MARTVSDIQADLDAAHAALRAAVTAQSYSLDDGQGKQSVTRASPSEIRAVIRDLENELDDASGDGGNYHGRLERYS